MCSKRAKEGPESGTAIACLAESSSRRPTGAFWPGSVKVNQSKSNFLIRRAPSRLVLGIWFFSGACRVKHLYAAWSLDAWSFTLPATRHPSPLTGLWTVDCGLRTARPSTPDPQPSSGPCTIVTIVTIIFNFLAIPNISIIAMIAMISAILNFFSLLRFT